MIFETNTVGVNRGRVVCVNFCRCIWENGQVNTHVSFPFPRFFEKVSPVSDFALGTYAFFVEFKIKLALVIITNLISQVKILSNHNN